MSIKRILTLENSPYQPPVLAQQDAPPGSPAKGDRYIVGESPSGAWVGQENDIAWWNGLAWEFDTPVNGSITYLEDSHIYYTFRNGGWKHSLVDVEEGSWAPIYTPNSGAFASITHSLQRGTFKRIDNLVQVNFLIATAANTAIDIGTGSGTLFIEGVPYSIQSTIGGVANNYSSGAVNVCVNFDASLTEPIHVTNIINTTSQIRMAYKNGASYTNATVGILNTANSSSSKNLLASSIVYVADI